MIPQQTVLAFARSICEEARRYGFKQLDTVRLINAIMDLASDMEGSGSTPRRESAAAEPGLLQVDSFPLRSERLQICLAEPDSDLPILEQWIGDKYGKHFLLSCATAQKIDLESLLGYERNQVGMVLSSDGKPIGAVAYLDIDPVQRRAELRKLIGDSSFRGKGYAEEATRLWIEYGDRRLKLDKIYVSTLQTHLQNIRLNEAVGFRVEGVLHREVCIAGERFDVLRMGLCVDERRKSEGRLRDDGP